MEEETKPLFGVPFFPLNFTFQEKSGGKWVVFAGPKKCWLKLMFDFEK